MNMRTMNVPVTTSDGVVTCPAGTYFVGDPCYAASHTTETWDRYLESSDFYRKPVATAPGKWSVGFSTAYGDGCYKGSDEFEYGVDAGLLGVVPVEFAEENALYAMNKVEFPESFRCFRDEDGTMHFGHIVIPTKWEDEADEDEEEDPWSDPEDEDDDTL